jgi:methionine salvage enolase-phosphatase E1
MSAHGSCVTLSKAVVESGQEMILHFDHPILFLQQMIWHEGYHHGQIKLALKAAGLAIPDKKLGPLPGGSG